MQERVNQVRAEYEAGGGMMRNLNDRVAEHRLNIIENILTLKCSQCKTAIYDFYDCFAVTCSACDGHFCGWCLQDFGQVNIITREIVCCLLLAKIYYFHVGLPRR